MDNEVIWFKFCKTTSYKYLRLLLIRTKPCPCLYISVKQIQFKNPVLGKYYQFLLQYRSGRRVRK